jgi:uncharacterized membrane protein (DUF2068 family)
MHLPHKHHTGWFALRFIAALKLLKAAGLWLSGGVVMKLVHHHDLEELADWFRAAHLNPGGHYVREGIEKIAGLSDHNLTLIGTVLFLYAVLYTIEGVGLWMELRWVEWMTVVTTSLAIPFEIFELFRHATWIKTSVLTANVAILAYLLWFVRRKPAPPPVVPPVLKEETS